uniref:Uncharacterized protein n=1 Tax=Cucumis melo TaxID=3656 RepID=A0A9I9E894_CUCME
MKCFTIGTTGFQGCKFNVYGIRDGLAFPNVKCQMLKRFTLSIPLLRCRRMYYVPSSLTYPGRNLCINRILVLVVEHLISDHTA